MTANDAASPATIVTAMPRAFMPHTLTRLPPGRRPPVLPAARRRRPACRAPRAWPAWRWPRAPPHSLRHGQHLQAGAARGAYARQVVLHGQSLRRRDRQPPCGLTIDAGSGLPGPTSSELSTTLKQRRQRSAVSTCAISAGDEAETSARGTPRRRSSDNSASAPGMARGAPARRRGAPAPRCGAATALVGAAGRESAPARRARRRRCPVPRNWRRGHRPERSPRSPRRHPRWPRAKRPRSRSGCHLGRREWRRYAYPGNR